jgi:hypothetical protein
MEGMGPEETMDGRLGWEPTAWCDPMFDVLNDCVGIVENTGPGDEMLGGEKKGDSLMDDGGG